MITKGRPEGMEQRVGSEDLSAFSPLNFILFYFLALRPYGDCLNSTAMKTDTRVFSTAFAVSHA